MDEENNLPIYVCTHRRGAALRELWRQIKHFN
jgi:hypothetical protein